MTTEERENFWRGRLKARAARLLRLLEMDGPSYIIVNEAFLILKAAIGLDHKPLGEMFFKFMAEHINTGAGICGSCGTGDIGAEASHPPRCTVCAASDESMLLEDEEKH